MSFAACPLISDIILVVDGSETINDGDSVGQDPSSFRIIQNSLVRLTRQFPISTSNVLMGLIQFSNVIDTEVQLGTVTNGDAMADAIDQMMYQNGDLTLTDLALNESARQLQTFGREGVTKQIILVTDGIPTNSETAIEKATEIKDNDVIITVISINVATSSARRILRDISSSGDVIAADNVNELDDLVENILSTTCPGINAVIVWLVKETLLLIVCMYNNYAFLIILQIT